MTSYEDDKRGAALTATTSTEKVPVAPPSPAITDAEDRRIRRRIDWHILPIICTTYALQYLDKSCLAYASVMGFRQDTHLSLRQYSWLGSIFNLGYLAGAYPMTWGLHRFPLSKFAGATIVVWGWILCMMAVGHNFSGLMAIRFFLGFFEASITPSLMLLTSQWYKGREQGTRTGFWTSMNTVGGIFGGAVSYGLAKADHNGTLSIPGWKIIFVLLGLMTAAIGVIFALFIPDSIDTARFLDEDGKRIAKERVRGNLVVIGEKHWAWDQVLEACLDPKVCWAPMLYH
ncbi:hypothetical protein VHUM_02839 [Vanrija humicola]|uniref:Major facilitator superfamily (MFS) profile domain-containing protein n=1 Tax=Vanrija humicola TaxID=5417 RepID=A0A7D8V4D0_VANHU|nr:hypothetical protein VHUM_02839 [Vanrija humicola]